jgi:hypothetical protein
MRPNVCHLWYGSKAREHCRSDVFFGCFFATVSPNLLLDFNEKKTSRRTSCMYNTRTPMLVCVCLNMCVCVYAGVDAAVFGERGSLRRLIFQEISSGLVKP